MTKILNYGSMNIDYVYKIDEFGKPGETIKSESLQIHCGGKGLNQSVALARAGANVFHAGKVGSDGIFLKEYLENCEIDTSYIEVSDDHTGHAIIEVDKKGENTILLYGGTNMLISKEEIDKVLSDFVEGDIILLQNEISNIPYIMQCAHKKKMHIFINPAPMNETVFSYPFEFADCIFLNEIEAAQLAHTSSAEEAIERLVKKYPDAMLVFTLGKRGVVCYKDGKIYSHGIYDVKVVDTTAAGDTFTGFFIACLSEKHNIEEALEFASKASSLSVMKEGASKSIPFKDDVLHSFV